MSERDRAAGPAADLRADARRNRAAILAAARDVFVEQDADAPLDEIARRAGVGIATLYRRFPDRGALARAVVLDLLRRVVEEAKLALAEERDAFQALSRYLHRALDLRVSAVLPALLGRVSFEDGEVGVLRDRSAALIEELIERAQAAGTLRPDVAFADVTLLLIRLARPLPGPIPRPLDSELAHRHLDLVLDGLQTGRDRPAAPLPGPALTREDLHALPAALDRPASRRQAAGETPDDRSSG
jgi:AcrR family transcriptional regulator